MWAKCPMELDGILKNMSPSHGEDLYAALISALEFFDRYFYRLEPHTQYFWPNGAPYEGEPLYQEPSA
jgi:hypothetical protein